jgi:hypothetical protein
MFDIKWANAFVPVLSGHEPARALAAHLVIEEDVLALGCTRFPGEAV